MSWVSMRLCPDSESSFLRRQESTLNIDDEMNAWHTTVDEIDGIKALTLDIYGRLPPSSELSERKRSSDIYPAS